MLPIRLLTLFIAFILALPYPLHATAVTDIKVPSLGVNFENFADLKIPSQLGNLEEIFHSPEKGPAFILIQDAHAVWDAQRSTQKLIEYFQKQYGVRQVGIEAGKGKLDPTLLKYFPDAFVRKKVLNEYLERGELSGADMAAVLSKAEATYQGLEDWKLYEAHYQAWFHAMQNQDALKAQLDTLRKEWDEKRRKIYSPELDDFHEKLRAFYQDRFQLTEFLRYLNRVSSVNLSPSVPVILSEAKNLKSEILRRSAPHNDKSNFNGLEKFPQLSKLLNSLEKEEKLESQSERIDVSLRRAAKAFETKYAPQLSRKQLMKYHQKYQAFVTDRLEPAAFLKYLQRAGGKAGARMRLTPAMQELLGHAQTLSMIRGTELFEELEAWIQKIQEALVQTDAESALVQDFRHLDLLETLGRLELTRAQFEQLKVEGGRSKVEGKILPPSTVDLRPFFAYYDLALQRDQALFTNAVKMASHKKESAPSVIVAGGFHTRGLTRLMKERNLSYAVIMPGIKSLNGQETYTKVMQGDVSYKAHLRVLRRATLAQDEPSIVEIDSTRGLNYFEAFMTHATIELMKNMNEPDFRKNFKFWRDQIIRGLAAEGRVAEAGRYTRFLEELVNTYYDKFGIPQNRTHDQILKSLADAFEKFRQAHIDKLLKNLASQKNLVLPIAPAALSPLHALDPTVTLKFTVNTSTSGLPGTFTQTATQDVERPVVAPEIMSTAASSIVTTSGTATVARAEARSEKSLEAMNEKELITALEENYAQALVANNGNPILTFELLDQMKVRKNAILARIRELAGDRSKDLISRALNLVYAQLIYHRDHFDEIPAEGNFLSAADANRHLNMISRVITLQEYRSAKTMAERIKLENERMKRNAQFEFFLQIASDVQNEIIELHGQTDGIALLHSIQQGESVETVIRDLEQLQRPNPLFMSDQNPSLGYLRSLIQSMRQRALADPGRSVAFFPYLFALLTHHNDAIRTEVTQLLDEFQAQFLKQGNDAGILVAVFKDSVQKLLLLPLNRRYDDSPLTKDHIDRVFTAADSLVGRLRALSTDYGDSQWVQDLVQAVPAYLEELHKLELQNFADGTAEGLTGVLIRIEDELRSLEGYAADDARIQLLEFYKKSLKNTLSGIGSNKIDETKSARQKAELIEKRIRALAFSEGEDEGLALNIQQIYQEFLEQTLANFQRWNVLNPYSDYGYFQIFDFILPKLNLEHKDLILKVIGLSLRGVAYANVGLETSYEHFQNMAWFYLALNPTTGVQDLSRFYEHALQEYFYLGSGEQRFIDGAQAAVRYVLNFLIKNDPEVFMKRAPKFLGEAILAKVKMLLPNSHPDWQGFIQEIRQNAEKELGAAAAENLWVSAHLTIMRELENIVSERLDRERWGAATRLNAMNQLLDIYPKLTQDHTAELEQIFKSVGYALMDDNEKVRETARAALEIMENHLIAVLDAEGKKFIEEMYGAVAYNFVKRLEDTTYGRHKHFPSYEEAQKYKQEIHEKLFRGISLLEEINTRFPSMTVAGVRKLLLNLLLSNFADIRVRVARLLVRRTSQGIEGPDDLYYLAGYLSRSAIHIDGQVFEAMFDAMEMLTARIREVDADNPYVEKKIREIYSQMLSTYLVEFRDQDDVDEAKEVNHSAMLEAVTVLENKIVEIYGTEAASRVLISVYSEAMPVLIGWSMAHANKIATTLLREILKDKLNNLMGKREAQAAVYDSLFPDSERITNFQKGAMHFLDSLRKDPKGWSEINQRTAWLFDFIDPSHTLTQLRQFQK